MLEKAKADAPYWCRYCEKIEAGNRYDADGKSELVPVCERQPDGITDDINDCLDLPTPCKTCGENSDCYMGPDVDSSILQECQDTNYI
jgi:hypothetical protein